MKFKSWAEQGATQLRRLLQQSQQLSPHLHPRLNRFLLNSVSEWRVPFLLGMGLRVTKVSAQAVEVCLPPAWRNQDHRGMIYPAAMVTTAIHASELFWHYVLDAQLTTFELERLECTCLKPARGVLTAHLQMEDNERERHLLEVRRSGAAEMEINVGFHDLSRHRVAEVQLLWKLTQTRALPSPARG